MKRTWLLLLLLSFGLNIGLGYAVLSRRGTDTDPLSPTLPSYGSGRGVALRDSVQGSTEEFWNRRLNRICRRLQLDPDQEKAFRQVRLETLSEIDTRRQEVRQTRRALHLSCLDPETPPDHVRQLVHTLAVAQGRLDSLVTETLLRELALLTPEQRQRYLATMPWDLQSPERPHANRQRYGQHRHP